MKLKTFDKVNVAIKCEYVVFRGEEPIDDFVVDYLGETKNISKKFEYMDMGATVRYVSVNTATNILSVTLDVK